MDALIVFGGPFVVAALFGAVLGRGWWSIYGLFGLGLLLGAGFVLWAYFSAPPDYQHSNGTEGEQFWGRWWEPTYIFFTAGFGYVCWLFGVCLGAFFGSVVRSAREVRDH